MKDVKSRGPASVFMNAAYYCGLDIHKESTYATIIDNDGQVVNQKRMKNEEIPDFLDPYPSTKVAMEASTYIAPTYRTLEEQGYNITVSHPKKTRYIAEARIKSDRVDSKILAELLRLDSLPVSQHTIKGFSPPKGTYKEKGLYCEAGYQA